MSVKICGHEVRANKVIKIYTLFKHLNLLLVLGAIAAPPSFAADQRASLSNISYTTSSTAGAAPCLLPVTKSRTDAASSSANGPQRQTQRSAGSSSPVSTLALALALGLRNAQGPVEYKTPQMNAAPDRVAMER